MSIEKTFLKDTVLHTVSRHFGYSMDELAERYENDDFRNTINEAIRLNPEQFNGLSPLGDATEFQLHLEDDLPFTDETVSFFFTDEDDVLTTSVVLLFEREFVEERAEAIEQFLDRSPLSDFLTMEDDGTCLILSSKCDSDTPDAIRDGLSRFLTALTADKSLCDAVMAFMEL